MIDGSLLHDFRAEKEAELPFSIHIDLPQEDEEENEDRDEKKATGQPASRSCPCMKSR